MARFSIGFSPETFATAPFAPRFMTRRGARSDRDSKIAASPWLSLTFEIKRASSSFMKIPEKPSMREIAFSRPKALIVPTDATSKKIGIPNFLMVFTISSTPLVETGLKREYPDRNTPWKPSRTGRSEAFSPEFAPESGNIVLFPTLSTRTTTVPVLAPSIGGFSCFTPKRSNSEWKLAPAISAPTRPAKDVATPR